MEDIAEKITKLLEDDKSAEMLSSFTKMLGNGNASGEEKKSAPDIKKIMQLAGGMKDDDRLRLMQALRPFVSEQKRDSLDGIMNILKLVQILSLLGDDFKLF